MGIRIAPRMVARLAENSSQRKSTNKVLAATCWSMPVSTRLAKVRLKNGPSKEFEVRDSSIRMLDRASETAMRTGGEGADDVDDERQCANQQQLLVHHNLAVKKMSFHAAMELLIFQLQIS